MATTVQINLTRGGGVGTSFPGPAGSPFLGYLYINGIFYQTIGFTVNTATTASSPVTALTPALLPGTYNFIIYFSSNVTTNGQGFILATLTFNDTPSSVFNVSLPVNGAALPTPPGGVGYSGTPVTRTIACLHGSSIIQMKEGSKRLDQIKEGDKVLTGDNKTAKVLDIAQCWLSFLGIDHDAIIFEPNSLGPNEPKEQLIIDPGHPMCTPAEYLERGFEALRPAGTYWEELKSDKIYSKKWTDIFVQNETSVRYDLILEEPFNTYIANGMVVRSKGYKDHRYKEFV